MAFKLVYVAAALIGGIVETAAVPPSIVLDGARDAQFVYDNAGNLIGSWAATAGTDSFGHAYPQGLHVTTGSISGSTFDGTDFEINSAGAFFYSGVPAAGNLIASIAPNAGSDVYGNPFPQGINGQHSAIANDAFGTLVNGILWLGQLGAGGTQDYTHASKVYGNGQGALALYSGTTALSANAALGLLIAGTDAAGAGPQLTLGDNDALANLRTLLNGDLSIEPHETGRVPLFVFAQPGQSADLVQLNVNNVLEFAVDASGNLYKVGTIGPLVTGHNINASSSTTVSTTYAASTTPLAATAVLPASGKAMCSFAVRCMNSGANNTLSDLQITGSTSGTLHAAADVSAIQWNQTTSAGPFITRTLITGVPGETITATAQHRVVAGTGTFLWRDITIETLPV